MSKTNIPATPAKPELHEVIVQRDHTHAGEVVKAGGTIKVTEAERAWLIAHGVVAPAAQQATEGGAQ